MENGKKPFNICDTLRKRLVEINDLKEATQTKINTKSEQLQKLYAKGNKSSRMTPSQLDAKIDELETQRTSTSLKLAEEKDILRQIAQIKKAKVLYEENKAHEKLIQEKKTEVNSHRTDLTKYKAQIAELEAALSKVELADRLGCTANDLTSHKMDCPVDKLGQVIGKGGSNIKKLESKSGCLIDLDKVHSQIHLQGNESSIKKAIAEIEEITLSIEEEINIGEALFLFLFHKQSAEFSTLQEKHPNVVFDLSKETHTMKLRGREEFVTPAKEHVLNIDVKMDKIQTPGREAALVVGKGGKTINRLIAEHDVSIQVESSRGEQGGSDKSTITVSGKGEKVNATMKEIKDILFNNEDMEVSILVSAMTRNRLLSDSGKLMKQLHKDINAACQPGNSYIRFEELAKGSNRESTSILLLKAARMYIEEAERVAKERIAMYESNFTTVQVDMDLIPVIIGQKGATIKVIKNAGGVGSDVEIDKLSGEIKIMADEESQRDAMKQIIDDIISENQILRVPMDSSMFSDLYGQAGRSVKGKIQNNGVFLKIDDSDAAILLRGPIEKITEAAEDIRQFIASNQSSEFSCDKVDEAFLNRRTSLMKNLEKEHDVKMTMGKSFSGVLIRGRKESIESAEIGLKKILFGGDGFSVEKLFVPASILGAIIGKGGKNIAKYETDHDPIMVNVHSLSNFLAIRGPSEKVEICKGAITKDIMDCNVNESIQIDEFAYEKLSKVGIAKLLSGLPVNLSLSENAVRLRGCYADVKEVMMNVNDLITGVYKTSIMLTLENFNFVSKQMQVNPSQFDKISESTETSMAVDNSSGSIVIQGKRSSVRRAKVILIGLLETLMPSTFMKTKFQKPLLTSMGSSKNISSMGEKTKCFIALERDICTFVVQGPSADHLKCAAEAITGKIEEIMKLTYIESVESWFIQYIIANYSQDIAKIKKDTSCEISLLKADTTISIVGKDDTKVTQAKQEMEKLMIQVRKENFTIDLPESSMSLFVGTSGKNMKSMAATYGVVIDRVKKTKSRIRIQGKETAVKRAKDAVLSWLSKWEKKNTGLTISMDDLMIWRLEKDLSILSDIQKDFGVKVDICRTTCVATIRGGKESSQAEACAELRSILMKENDENNAATVNNFMGKAKENKLPQAVIGNETLQISYHKKAVSQPFVERVIEDPVTAIESDSPNKNSSSAVGNLYNLLVSDDVAQQWDSSTVSSKVENENESPETGVSYYRSASGFHIRL